MRKWTGYLRRCPFIASINGQPRCAETASTSAFTCVHHRKLISTSVYPRVIVARALALNAAAVILAHQHPSGVAEPSQADERITQRLKAALELVDVRVLDHLVIGGDTSVSLASRGLL